MPSSDVVQLLPCLLRRIPMPGWQIDLFCLPCRWPSPIVLATLIGARSRSSMDVGNPGCRRAGRRLARSASADASVPLMPPTGAS